MRKQNKNLTIHPFFKLVLVSIVSFLFSSCASKNAHVDNSYNASDWYSDVYVEPFNEQDSEIIYTKFSGDSGFYLGAQFNASFEFTSENSTITVSQLMKTQKEGISILSRQFIKAAEEKIPFYAYYFYLIFTEKTALNYKLRQAAAQAFMCQLQDTSEARAIGVPVNEIAVFYAPVSSDTNIADLIKSESSNDLLSSYNYSYSKILLNKIRESANIDNKCNVAIIANPSPLLINGEILNIGNLQFIDLSNTSPSQISTIVRQVIEQTTHPDVIKNAGNNMVLQSLVEGNKTKESFYYPQLNYINPNGWATKVRKIFASLGSLLNSVVKNAEANEFICK